MRKSILRHSRIRRGGRSISNGIFILLVGASGSGKTTIANQLCEQLGYKSLNSYTTRKPREPHETGHIFIQIEPIVDLKKKYPNRVAETIFDGHFYFSTMEQVDESDIYVISPDAVSQFKENYKGKKRVKVIYLKVPDFLRRNRMRKRGDADEMIEQRIQHDKLAFSNAEADADLVVINLVKSETVDEIVNAIKKWEKEKHEKKSNRSRHR